MKKIAIFFLIIIIIIVGMSYLYLNYKASYNKAKQENKQFESYEGQEIYGAEVATIINRAIDNNQNYEVPKDKKGKYIDNDKNSIEIDIKMLDNDTTYEMETLYNGGIEKFVEYYNEIKFKCTKLEYHKATNKVKYLLLEQITE